MGGRRLLFDEVGIFNGVFVMEDRQTKSMWSHYTGEALSGPLKGTRLKWVNTQRGEFSRLLGEHPDATVLGRKQMRWKKKELNFSNRKDTTKALKKMFSQTLKDPRDDLEQHTHGMGVGVGTEKRFYPIDLLYDEAVIEDSIGGVDAVILIHDGSSTAAAYSRCLDGQPLRFVTVQYDNETHLLEDGGTLFNASGLAVKGPLKGKQLTSLRSMITDWYGWAAYFPQTTVYEFPFVGPVQE